MSPHARRVALRNVSILVENLEQRRLLCGLSFDHLIPAPTFDWDVERAHTATEGLGTNIVWSNRGQANDNFAATFGTSAATARAVVDAALLQWQRVILDWNRNDGTSTLQVNISISGSGFGGAGAPSATAPSDGRPRTGSFTLGSGNNSADPNDDNGWYLDPNPTDFTEFDGEPMNAYAAPATANLGRDFYSVVVAELTHVLGLISDKNNNGGGFDGYLLESSGFATFTDIDDNAEGNGNGHFWVFDGPTVDHLMTSFNSGDQTDASWGNIVHSAGSAGNINFAGKNWRGSEDAGNASYSADERTIPSFAMSHVLADAYGYTVIDPHNFGSFYMMQSATGELFVRGGAGNSSDDITITRNGAAVRVSVNVGTDAPGTGPFSGAQDLPAFVTDFNNVTAIRIDAFGGDDDILIETVASGRPITIDAGDGTDTIRLGDVGNTLNNIDSDVVVFGGAGTDHVLLDDSTNDLVDDTYTFDVNATGTTFDRGAFPLVTLSGVETADLETSGGFDTFNVNRLSLGLALDINASGGNDTLNLAAPSDDLGFIAGDLAFQAGTGTDVANLFDTTPAGATTFTLANGGINHVLDRPNFGSLSFGTQMETVNLSTGAGANTFNLVELNSFTTLTINAGGGNDRLNLGTAASQTLDPLDGPIVFNGEAGTDDVILSDQTSAALNTYTFTSDTLDRVGFGLLDFDGAVETVTLNGGAGANTYVIEPSLVSLAADVTVNALASADTFEVAPGSNSMQLVINADLTFHGGGGVDTINLHDSASSVSFPYAIDLDSITRGASPVNYSGVELITLDGATGSNAFSVVANTAELVLDGNDGSDSLVVGGAAQNLDNIDGNITFTGGPGTDTLELRDQQNAAAGTYIVTGTTFDRSAFPLLTYGTVETFTVQGGTAANAFAVQGLAGATDLVLFGNGGNDQFLLGSAASSVEPLDGAITAHGGANSDSIVINDQAELLGFGFTVTATTVGRTGFGGLTYDTAESLTVNAGNATGSVGKFHNIESTAAGTSVALNAGSGNDSIRISNTAMLVSNIAANVNVNGQGGTDAMVIQDANNVNDDVHSLSGTTYQSDNSATISYGGVEGLTLNAGAGGSDINLAGSLATTPLTINAGAGGDSINLAALGGFAGAVTANGQGGDDLVFVNDQVPGTDAYTLTSSTLARTGFAGLTYGTSEQFVLLAQDGGNLINVNSTVGPTRIDANDGTDTINVNEAGSQAEVTLDPSNGNDTLNVNADNVGNAAVITNASHTFGAVTVGAGGFFFSTANGAHVLRTATLNLNAAARFDLADNTLLIDYTGVSPLAAIRTRLTSGYAGGAWNGPGINSSRAAATAGRALGYAEASALFSTFPVTFAGQSIDSTTVIVRYTRYGDANLDRAVNLQDFNRLVAGFGTGTLWSEGNFNYDASTNLSDFNLLSGNFGQGAAGDPGELPTLPGRHARDESR